MFEIHIYWKANKFLICFAEVIIQKMEEGMIGSAMMDCTLSKSKEFVRWNEEIKAIGTLGKNNYGILEFLIERAGKGKGSQMYTLNFRKADFIGSEDNQQLSTILSHNLSVKSQCKICPFDL